jgi:hypothetical protein
MAYSVFGETAPSLRGVTSHMVSEIVDRTLLNVAGLVPQKLDNDSGRQGEARHSRRAIILLTSVTGVTYHLFIFFMLLMSPIQIRDMGKHKSLIAPEVGSVSWTNQPVTGMLRH